MSSSSDVQWRLRRGSVIYPMPVAIACGRVLRARTTSERVNACIKAAEVLTRYLAAVAVASYASRGDEGEAKLSELSGNLPFGRFLRTVQEIASTNVNHPVAPLLAQGFKATKQNKHTVPGKTDAALIALLELRNGDGHDLRNLDEAKAFSIEVTIDPVSLLLDALDGVEALLSKPLFVVERQEWTREALVVSRLLLMGESSDPEPESVMVGHETGGVTHTRAPYVAVNKCCLHLPPWLLWEIVHERLNFALLFLDGIKDESARYCTLDGIEQDRSVVVVNSIRHVVAGARWVPDTLLLIDGRHLASEWADTRRSREESARRQDGLVDWNAFDANTIKWYAGLLDSAADDAHALVRDRLLDGRTNFNQHELHQLVLLFGTKAKVRATLGRDVLDVRIIDDETKRPRKRELVESENLLVALRRAVAFLSDALANEALSPEDLRQMDGGVDYLTIREMLVNQLIHQDYCDSRTSAQIELYADRLTLTNAGYSLVPMGELLEGGRSQSRNPLIARALRAIGFAELSGFGIRALVRALRKARRKAPRFISDQEGNTFKVTLEWTEEAPDVDAFWMELVGARLTNEQALVLNTLAELPSASVTTIEGATQIPLEEITRALDFLVFQVLVEQDEANYSLAQHLREKLG